MRAMKSEADNYSTIDKEVLVGFFFLTFNIYLKVFLK